MTLVVVGFYVLFYMLFSIPAFTNLIKDRAAKELSTFLGGEVSIGELEIYPFNEVKIYNLEVYDPIGQKCLEVSTIGAGIRLWKLLLEGNIQLSYGEIIGLKANIIQEEKDSGLNIDFIIRAFSPKNDKKEKSPFELALHNVVLRKSSVTFQRPWLRGSKVGLLDLSYLDITDLAADISFPKISDKGIEVDLRRLSFKMPDILDIETIKLKGEFSGEKIAVSNFTIEFPSSRLFIPEINLNAKKQGDFFTSLNEDDHKLIISESYLTLSDFAFLWSPLGKFNDPFPLSLEAYGNIDAIAIDHLNFGSFSEFLMSLSGSVEGLSDIKTAKANLDKFSVSISSSVADKLKPALNNLPANILYALSHTGNITLSGEFAGDMEDSSLKGNIDLISSAFTISVEGGILKNDIDIFEGTGEINIQELKLNQLFPGISLNNVNANIIADGFLQGKIPEGIISLVIDNFELKGKRYDGLSLNISKNENDIEGDLLVNNEIANITSNFKVDIESIRKKVDLDVNILELNMSEITDMKQYDGYIISGNISANGDGSTLNDLIGELNFEGVSFVSPFSDKKLKLDLLKLTASVEDSIHLINIESDWFDARIEGDVNPKGLKKQGLKLLESVFPALLSSNIESSADFTSDIGFDILIKKNNSLTEFFNLPVRLLVPVSITGNIESINNTASLTLDVPYLQQGKDKLIYDSRVNLNIDGNTGTADALIETTMPVKKGDLALNVNLFAQHNNLSTDIRWINTINSDFKGHLTVDTEVERNNLSLNPAFNVRINPSILQMGTAEWKVSPSTIIFRDKQLMIENLKIAHDNQFVDINGTASENFADVLRVKLEDIDVDYVFDMLQINYVTFGGSATGEVAGHSLLSSDPVAETESFFIKDFSYNNCLFGDCVVTSKWNNEEKEIEITADIINDGRRCVLASGGIWLGRDSLSFNIDADKIPVDFVQPFMSVFSSHVGGFATGDVKLFGTFHDIDMTGKIFADSVAVKLDYTNTIYHGSDSVYLNPGQIEIPHFRLYDKFGHSALLTGELSHRYFHDPSFTFRLSDANDLLCYDTNSDINPDWYGTLYGNGSALLTGVPGNVDISADMTITGSSNFTFVLNDTQYAQDYQFLTFSDKRKEEKRKLSTLTVDDFKEMLRKNMAQEEGSLSTFGIDIRATVTPQALFTLVMDPAAGDKITARGKGAMQVKYESDDDEMMMYGKYEIDEGNYNFSLQDIILRDFKIKEGSYITFNGDPLRADLNISATYRVNTNLSDLDKSFSTDRDLNRTNVPVDAVLSVEGNMQQPDITFDIELPTLTQDVERKVKSIISTDDMMNRQIIYLLALNRFYTPEYMGSSGNGGELAAVASSTISSQLSNILGQLTDKFSVSPSFRSDKGDFSDIEVDVALSSRLLNNRLLINGNFGYRDRSNSSTTFVGDFDVEYLLSKNGNFRLKAYNHFNDQNYYLREALTTQGLGVVYRRDFDDWFTFLKKRKKQIKEETEEAENDNNPEIDTETTAK